MMTRIVLQPAYVMHTRQYRDTSLLVDLLTSDYGRLHIVAKGARNNRSPLKGLLQPFVPLLISCQGKTDLLTLTHAETNNTTHILKGKSLLSGLYLNEILIRLLERHEALPKIFEIYCLTLQELAKSNAIPAAILRRFEKYLLAELGYAFSFQHETISGKAIEPEEWYRFDPTNGIARAEYMQEEFIRQQQNIFLGRHLLAIQNEQFEELEVLRDAKRIFQASIQELLGSRILKSREIFRPR